MYNNGDHQRQSLEVNTMYDINSSEYKDVLTARLASQNEKAHTIKKLIQHIEYIKRNDKGASCVLTFELMRDLTSYATELYANADVTEAQINELDK